MAEKNEQKAIEENKVIKLEKELKSQEKKSPKKENGKKKENLKSFKILHKEQLQLTLQKSLTKTQQSNHCRERSVFLINLKPK